MSQEGEPSTFELEPLPGRPPPHAAPPEAQAEAKPRRAPTNLERISESIPPPPDWPREVLSYPLRTGARWLFLFYALPLCVTDWVLAETSVQAHDDPMRRGAVGHLLALGLVHSILHVARRSAAGHDQLQQPAEATYLRGGAGWGGSYRERYYAGYWTLFRAEVILIFPLMCLYLLAMTSWALAGLCVASPLVAIASVAATLRDPGLLRPDRAFAWALRSPGAYLGMSLCWLVALGWTALLTSGSAHGAGLLLILLGRLAVTYLLIVAGRIAGVVARNWSILD